MCHLMSLGVRSGLEVGVLRIVDSAALVAGARRRRGGGLLAAALGAAMIAGPPVAVRLARTRHQLPVDDRVRPPLSFEARAADRRIDGVRGLLLRVEDAEVLCRVVRVDVTRLPCSLKEVKSFRLFSR